MKKTAFLRILLSSVVILAVFTLTASATGEASVTYRNRADNFIFLPGEDNIFPNFSEVMPGDTLTQRIDVENSSTEAVKLLFSIETPNEKDLDFFSYLHLTMTYYSPGGLSQKIYDDKLSLLSTSPNHLGTPASMGEYKSGDRGYLLLNLTVDELLPNEYSGYSANINWIFSAEEVVPASPTPTPSPVPTKAPIPFLARTGETINQIMPIIVVVLVLAAGLVVFFLWRRRKNDDKEATPKE